MSTLKDYLLESMVVLEEGGISDNQILYTIGVNWVNGSDAGRYAYDEYKINKNNYREKIIQLAKDKFQPLIEPKDEIIPRSKWDLKSLIGETENQLLNKQYYEAANIMLKEPRKHDVLTLFQCSAKKPYYDNKPYSKGYINWAKEWTDAASISNPGVIFWDYSDKYPYRYDEWSIASEKKLHELLDMTYKYRIVNMCRFIRMMRKRQYKHVLVVIPNQMKQWIFDEIKKHDIDGLDDKIEIVISQHLRDALDRTYPKLKNLMPLRMQSMGAPRKAYIKCLRKVVKPEDKDHFEEVTQAQLDKCKQVLKESYNSLIFLHSDLDEMKQIIESYSPVHVTPLTESKKQPEYKIMDFTPADIIKKFKNSDTVKDNMADPSVDKGSNKLYYKSYYWTGLDILLMAMDGNLTEDIDGTYWDLREALDKDSDFETFGDFCYIYKPLMKNDNVTNKDLEEEAYKLHILRPEPELVPNKI